MTTACNNLPFSNEEAIILTMTFLKVKDLFSTNWVGIVILPRSNPPACPRQWTHENVSVLNFL